MRCFRGCVPGVRDERVATEFRDRGRERQGVGDDATLSASGSDELSGLEDVLAQDQMVLDAIPEARMTQRLLGAFAVRSVLGIGDGKSRDPSLRKRGGQLPQFGIGLEGRSVRHHDHDPP